jgi:ubiquinone/menaquinone biosynthesis C-methylase UbiE
MVDLGCGTGFLVELAPSDVKTIYGVDVTDAMLEILRKKNISRLRIIKSPVENIPLDDGIADFVTGYSVLDHFENPDRVFQEAARLLRPDGVFYMDLIPNGEFWRGIRSVDHTRQNLSTLVAREIGEVASHGRKMLEQYGVPHEVLAAAEPHKELSDGFLADKLEMSLRQSGFTDVKIAREWFLGEAPVLHQLGPDAAVTITNHLRLISPLSDHLFKYLWFTAKRAHQ